MANGAETLKRVFLELGGKSVFMVLDDVPEQAFPMVIAGSMVVFHAGQGCAYPTRLLVPKSKYAMAVAILEKAYAGYAEKWGKFEEPTRTEERRVGKECVRTCVSRWARCHKKKKKKYKR